jgi:hypothetical protein
MTDDPKLHTHDTTRPESTTRQTRQAVPQNVFTVLAVSLVLVVAAFTAIYFW